jgi:fatty-acyl-CoA synthase
VTVPDLLARRAALSGDRTAFHGGADAPALSYVQLDALADRLAAGLAARGLGEGDRVAVLAHDRPDFFALLFACARARLILVPLNRRLAGPELAAIVADADPALLLADAVHLARARALHPAVLPLDGLAQDGPSRRDGWDADAPWYLLYTSGTTAAAKGVIQTVAMALANLTNAVSAAGLSATDTVLATMPLYHTAGINLYALPALLCGASVDMLAEFDAATVARRLASGPATIVFAVPQAYQRLFADPGFRAPPRVRHWGCGGGPLPAGLVEAASARDVLLLNGMGMTETGPTAFVMDPSGARLRPASAGRAQLLVDVRIVADGRDCAAEEIGEIWFRGPAVTPGYWRRPDETAAAFDGGWLRSGDLGRLDAEGYVTIVGRLKDMFVSGGENVYPAEVETVLAAHPAIAEAAVIGLPDARWGEAGHAWLVVRPGCAAPDAGTLDRWCRDRIAAFKVPCAYTFVDALPRTSNGKVRKRDLVPPREAVAA